MCGPVGIDRWFSDVGLAEMWQRDFEGGMVAEFLVVKNTVNVFFFFFFSSSGLTCDDASNKSMFAVIPKLTQDNQNKTKQ